MPEQSDPGKSGSNRNGSDKKVSDLGEEGLIARFAARAGVAPGGQTWIGDDAAFLPSPGEMFLYSTDVMVEGADFDFRWSSGADLGWKVVAINASDIAAMGGAPRYGVCALSLRPDTLVDVVDDIIGGVFSAAARWNIDIVGGDISSARAMSLSMAIIGAPAGAKAVHRSGASPGDAICVTGAVGGAAAGLALLASPDATPLAGGKPAGEREAALAARLLRPEARVAEGAVLAGFASAMIDVSDGLAVDLDRLISASNRGCVVDLHAIPIDPALESSGFSAEERLHFALSGGEDYELLCTMAEADVVEAASRVADLGTPLTKIGEVTSTSVRSIGDRELSYYREVAWDHLRRG